MEQRKIKSVLDLARYKVGDVAWWVILRPLKTPLPTIETDDKWMEKHHPKVLYERGPYKTFWPNKALLPKLQHMDFTTIVGVLTSELKIESFPVCDLIRSRDTGEFFYCNDADEWMPETFLFDSRPAADREKTRIFRLIQKWMAKPP